LARRWVRAGAVSDFPEEALTSIELGGRRVNVVRTPSGTIEHVARPIDSAMARHLVFRLPVIRDLGLSLLPPAAKPVPRAVASPDDVNEPVPV